MRFIFFSLFTNHSLFSSKFGFRRNLVFTFLIAFLSSSQVYSEAKPALLLANVYNDQIDINDYWVSEKYDGIRAFWNGQFLVSRQGNRIDAPSWFTQDLPATPLDGELWIARHSFEALMSVVHQGQAHPDWHRVTYMVFDLPNMKATFDARLEQLSNIVDGVGVSHIQMVEQQKFTTKKLLELHLRKIVHLGGEGLMLHRGSSPYKHGRHDDLLKLKLYSDDEAEVLAHFPGKGKYKDKMGAILVKNTSGIVFKIGTGFSDDEREAPPEVGAIITYKYVGLTKNRKPKFASFLRERKGYRAEFDGKLKKIIATEKKVNQE